MQQDLGVGARAEAVAPAFQLAAELGEVENLPVVDHLERGIFVGHRLRAAGQVDDAQPDVRQAHALIGKDAGAVGPTMTNRLRHAAQRAGGYSPRFAARDAGETAHQAPSPLAPLSLAALGTALTGEGDAATREGDETRSCGSGVSTSIDAWWR